jgi:hypothetical protein
MLRDAPEAHDACRKISIDSLTGRKSRLYLLPKTQRPLLRQTADLFCIRGLAIVAQHADALIRRAFSAAGELLFLENRADSIASHRDCGSAVLRSGSSFSPCAIEPVDSSSAISMQSSRDPLACATVPQRWNGPHLGSSLENLFQLGSSSRRSCPTRMFVPMLTVTGRSVLLRRVRRGTPN